MSRRLALIFCISIGILFFADALVGDRTVIPAGFLYADPPWSNLAEDSQEPAQQFDLLYQFYPWAQFFKESIWNGRVPLWNPYNYLGTPFFANPQTAMLFPPTWLHLVFPLRYSFTLLFMVKLLLLLTGMYFYLERQKLHPASAMIGVLVFGFSMHTVVSIPFPYSNVTVLLPWLLLAVHEVIRNADRLRILTVTSLLSLIVLAGQPQSTLPAFLAVAIFCGTSLWQAESRFRGLIPLLLAVVAAALISAVQWLPSFAYAWESMVPEGPRIIKSGYPYTGGSLLNLIIPDFFGSQLREDFWGFPGYHDMAFYSSITALLLTPFALVRKKLVDLPLFAIFTLLIALGVILGVPPFENLLDLPGFELLRRNKFVFLLIFSVAELAAHGANRLHKLATSRVVITGLCVSALLLITAVVSYWWFLDFLQQLDPSSFTFSNLLRMALFLLLTLLCLVWMPARRKVEALVLIVILDLIWLSFPLNPRGNADLLYPKLGANSKLIGDPARIYAPDRTYFPNTGMVYGLQDVRGYDVMTPRRFFRYMQAIDPNLGNAYDWLMRFDPDEITRNTRMRRIIARSLEGDEGELLKKYLQSDSYWSVTAGRIENWRLFDRLQVEYLLNPFEKTVPEKYHPFEYGYGVRALRNPDARPFQAFSRWQSIPESEVLEKMKERSSADIVFVPDSDQFAQNPDRSRAEAQSRRTGSTSSVGGGQSAGSAGASRAEIELLKKEPERSRYSIENDQPVILVEFERYSSGWHGRLENGESLDVFPADYIFRGVLVPAGKHVVELYYAPDEFRVGLALSAGGLFLLILLFIWPSSCPSIFEEK